MNTSEEDPRIYHHLSATQVDVVTAVLAIEMTLYVCVFCFILFNFWRIIVMQRKFTLIPLLIFYVSSPIICCARFCDCLYFIMYYQTDPEQGME